jgi:type II secretory pathway pseudopilin PulG
MKRMAMKKRVLKGHKGITLVEILIAALLTLIIGAAALGFYVSQHNSWLVQEDVSEMQQNLRVVLDEISKNIRRAGYGVPAGHPTIVLGSDTLTLFYQDSVQIDTVQYYVSWVDTLHPRLVRKVNANYARAYAEDIESITFGQAEKLITVTIVAREPRRDPEYTGDGYRRRTITSKALVRNRI